MKTRKPIYIILFTMLLFSMFSTIAYAEDWDKLTLLYEKDCSYGRDWVALPIPNGTLQLNGESDLPLLIVVTEFEEAGAGGNMKISGKDMYDNAQTQEFSFSDNIDIRTTTRWIKLISIGFRAVKAHIAIYYPEGGSTSGGEKPTPPWYRVRWERIKELLKVKVQAPIWALWTQAQVTINGVLSTIGIAIFAYFLYKTVYRTFFKRKWRIKKVIIER